MYAIADSRIMLNSMTRKLDGFFDFNPWNAFKSFGGRANKAMTPSFRPSQHCFMRRTR